MGVDRRNFLAGCAAVVLQPPGIAGQASAAGRRLKVEIRRDAFGVPYVSGETDAACAYGLGYAQGEDGLAYIEDCYLRSLGRGAEVHGEEAIADDRMVRALEIPRIARDEYARCSPQMRAIYDAFTAGLTRFGSDSGTPPRHFASFEPWLPLALLRFKYYVREFVGYSGLTDADREGGSEERLNGSNAWALAPSRTSGGSAMLLINPHVEFFGPARYYECTLHSREGLRFQGITRYGLPIPYMGHNDVLGWANTDNYPDFCDLYAEDIRGSGDAREYRYGNEWRPLRQWAETVRVRMPDGSLQERRESFAATHHGPIVGERDGKPLAIRLARLEDDGWMDQQYAMCRARNLAEFRAASARCAVPYMNIVYADAAGNIFYAYAGAVPRRSDAYDWTNPVDGTDPGTEWQGYHGFDELPHVLNPASGYVQNCNSTPFTAAGPGADRRSDYPRYMIGPEQDNLRAKQSRKLLESREAFSFDDWLSAATNSSLYAAGEQVPELMAAWSALPEGTRRNSLEPLVRELRDWDGVATTDSMATTLFVRWLGKMLDHGPGKTPAILLELLESTRDELADAFGTALVPWGEANRLQRIGWNAPVRFNDESPSLPVRGVPGWAGAIFNFYTRKPEGTKRRYGVMGNSFVAAVEFSAVPKARSVLVFGQSMEPESGHYLDQARLYAAGKFKRSWWRPADIAENTMVTKRLLA
jgi:acyl-homoserine-lactone acylase